MAHDKPESIRRFLAHFHVHGWVRVREAFDAEAARSMRDSVWGALETVGMYRHRPETWVGRPPSLQHLKADPVFQRVGSSALVSAIDSILEGLPYEKPSDWGAFFLTFPGKTTWQIPTRGWHIDACYTSPLLPMRGVKTMALFGDVVPRGGGTLMLSGSHRLVHQWFQENPPPRGIASAHMRRLLKMQPYIRDLHNSGDVERRAERFMRHAEDVNGIPLQVVEVAGNAGDVFLLHPLIMHVASPNNALEPRFMISGGVTTDMWGWASMH